tara:strand:+ start:15093 stop:15551 length:459 start_codon:yes stop_codon:yes gene_type:complete
MRFQLPILLLASLLSACGSGRRRAAITVQQQPRLVSVLVEVYDPITNLAWENVSVRIVEADQEWSGCTCASPYTDWYLTDSTGRVLLDEYLLADAEVGFVVDSTGAAVLVPEYDEDEATVVLEIDAVGFAPVFVEVPISWADPDVFVEVPFY